MILTKDVWTQITTSAGCMIQKHSAGTVLIAYANGVPTTEDTFGVYDSEPQLFPASGTLNIYALSKGVDRLVTKQVV